MSGMATVKIGTVQLGERERRVLEEALDLRAALHRGQLGLAGQLLEVSAADRPQRHGAAAARKALDEAERLLLPDGMPWPLGATGDEGTICQLLAAMIRKDPGEREEAEKALAGGRATFSGLG